MKNLKLTFICWWSFSRLYVSAQDPCDVGNYVVRDDPWRSPSTTTNDKCDAAITEDWYRMQINGTDADIPTSCQYGCGSLHPIWMNDSIPEPSDDTVSRKVCYTHGLLGLCCYDHYQIEVKNCGGFRVYHLLQAPGCSMTYCFESLPPTDAITTVGTIDQTTAQTVQGFISTTMSTTTTSQPETTFPSSTSPKMTTQTESLSSLSASSTKTTSLSDTTQPFLGSTSSKMTTQTESKSSDSFQSTFFSSTSVSLSSSPVSNGIPLSSSTHAVSTGVSSVERQSSTQSSTKASTSAAKDVVSSTSRKTVSIATSSLSSADTPVTSTLVTDSSSEESLQMSQATTSSEESLTMSQATTSPQQISQKGLPPTQSTSTSNQDGSPESALIVITVLVVVVLVLVIVVVFVCLKMRRDTLPQFGVQRNDTSYFRPDSEITTSMTSISLDPGHGINQDISIGPSHTVTTRGSGEYDDIQGVADYQIPPLPNNNDFCVNSSFTQSQRAELDQNYSSLTPRVQDDHVYKTWQNRNQADSVYDSIPEPTEHKQLTKDNESYSQYYELGEIQKPENVITNDKNVNIQYDKEDSYYYVASKPQYPR